MIILGALLVAASTASAGMGGGPIGNGMPGRPDGSAGHIPAALSGGTSGMALIVGDDGTVFTIRRIAGDPEAPGSGSMEVIAVSTSGTTLWTWTADGGVHGLEIAGDLVLVCSTEADVGHVPGTPHGGMENDSILHALAISSGTEVWQLGIEGKLMMIESSANVIYAVMAEHDLAGNSGDIVPRGGMHPPNAGQGMGNLKLLAITFDGSVKWTLGLNE